MLRLVCSGPTERPHRSAGFQVRIWETEVIARGIASRRVCEGVGRGKIVSGRPERVTSSERLCIGVVEVCSRDICGQRRPGWTHACLRYRWDCVCGRELQPTSTPSIGERLDLHGTFVLNYYLLRHDRSVSIGRAARDAAIGISTSIGLDEYLINFGHRR